MSDFEVVPHSCPHCGRVNELAGGAPDKAPVEGDVSLCWQCGGIAIFTAGGSSRLPTHEEAIEIGQSPEVRAARHAIAESFRPSEAIAMLRGRA